MYLRAINPFNKLLDKVLKEFDKQHERLEAEVHIATLLVGETQEASGKRQAMSMSGTAGHIPL
jgi:hypothetical protein